MITSTSNAKVKRLVSLKKKRKARDEEKVFLVEGIRMFREMPLEILREVYMSETFYRKDKKTAREVLAGSGIVPEILSDTVFGYVSDTRTHHCAGASAGSGESGYDPSDGGGRRSDRNRDGQGMCGYL